MVTRFLFALAAILAPGAFAWWTARYLARRADDATLAERVFARGTRIAEGVIVAVLVLAVLRAAAWTIPLMLAFLVIGLYLGRKALLNEQWGLGAYAVYLVRFWGASMGIWLPLALTPIIVAAAGPARWPAAAILAVGLSVWSSRWVQVFRLISGARCASLSPGFEEIIRRSTEPSVQFLRFGFPGARVIQAFALFHPRHPAVAFTDSVLEYFDAEEQTAIFAHEVAHLEYLRRGRLLRKAISMWALIILSTFGIAAAPAWKLPWAGLWGTLAVLLVLLIALARHKAMEEQGDLRAVELCGNAEVLVRALAKLHTMALLPRRWALGFERHASHPSLARRIQAIRRTTGAPPPPASGATPVVITGKAKGTLVLLEPDRFVLLTGVPDDAPRDPALLGQRVGAQVASYDDLVELRVRTGLIGSPALVAVSRTGQAWFVQLEPHSVAAVQTALDAVDVRLAPAPAVPRAPLLACRIASLVQAAAIVAGLAAYGAVGLIGALGTSLSGLLWPNRAAMASLTATAVGAAVILLWLEGLGVWGAVAAATALLAAAALATWALVRLRPELAIGAAHAWLPIGLQVGYAAWLLGTVTVAFLRGRAGARVEDLGEAAPYVALAVLGLGVALVTVRSRPVRLVGITLVALSVWLAVGLG
ncbi:MAG: M48 family metalloprotease [bacterium]|nr:M48 family metalloprotease [bacterium]